MSVWTNLGAVLTAISAGGAQVIDRLVQAVRSRPEGVNSVGFTVAMIALSAKMAKADGVVTTDEVLAFQELFDIPSGEERNVDRLFNLAKTDVAGFDVYARKLADLLQHDVQTLGDVLDGLFHIAKADGIVHEREISFLSEVAVIFGLDEYEFRRLQARHVRGAGDPYLVLGLDPDASNDDVKTQYRREVREVHPDRLVARGVPEEFVRIANDRLVALNAAWSQICVERGI